MFAERLRNARKQKGYTLEQLAELYNKTYDAGLSKGTLSKYENNKQEPMINVVSNLSAILGVSIDYLLGNDTSKHNSINHEQPLLTDKDEKDIARVLSNTLEKLSYNSEALMFDGEVLDDETQELLKNSLENALRMGKVIAKQKYNPKKNQK